ncbi:unnamed protein product, partial [Urochloa humidicola]
GSPPPRCRSLALPTRPHTSAAGSAVARRQRISIGEEYWRRTGEARKYGMEPLRAASSTKNENLQRQRNSMITKLASRIKRLESYTDHAAHQVVQNCNSGYLLCNWTMPVQGRIHLAQEHFVSREKKRSGILTFGQVERNLKIEITCQES